MRSILFFFLFFSLITSSQNMKSHQWKNRVLLVISDNKSNVDFANQTQLLKDKSLELIERKLIVYQITKNAYSYNYNQSWILSTKLYRKHNKEKATFKVILIGLDGGIKLKQTSILSEKKLFTIIDGMPMRKQELKNK